MAINKNRDGLSAIEVAAQQLDSIVDCVREVEYQQGPLVGFSEKLG